MARFKAYDLPAFGSNMRRIGKRLTKEFATSGVASVLLLSTTSSSHWTSGGIDSLVICSSACRSNAQRFQVQMATVICMAWSWLIIVLIHDGFYETQRGCFMLVEISRRLTRMTRIRTET